MIYDSDDQLRRKSLNSPCLVRCQLVYKPIVKPIFPPLPKLNPAWDDLQHTPCGWHGHNSNILESLCHFGLPCVELCPAVISAFTGRQNPTLRASPAGKPTAS